MSHKRGNSNARHPHLFFLAKLCTAKQYAEDFLDGRLYANRVRYFRDHCIDPYEGVTLLQPSQCQLRVGSRTIPESAYGGPIKIRLDRVSNLHIFCMFAFHSGEFDVLDAADVEGFLKKRLGSIDECNQDLGEHAVVIRDGPEFQERLRTAISEQDNILQARQDLVTYYDPDTFHMGDLEIFDVPFHKRNIFSHQNEYRLMLDSGTVGCDHYILDIGSIRDIAGFIRTSEIYKSVKISSKDDGKPLN